MFCCFCPFGTLIGALMSSISLQQLHYIGFSMMQVESEYLPLYSNYGIGLTTWSPLASGVLTGKYNKGSIPPDSRFALENYKVRTFLVNLIM